MGAHRDQDKITHTHIHGPRTSGYSRYDSAICKNVSSLVVYIMTMNYHFMFLSNDIIYSYFKGILIFFLRLAMVIHIYNSST